MSYRNLTVQGTEYQYVVGKSHTKIRGLGVIENAKIGSYRVHGLRPCGDPVCTCDPYEYVYLLHVKPKDIAVYITMDL